MSFIVKVDIGDPSTELIHETSADLVCVLSGQRHSITPVLTFF